MPKLTRLLTKSLGFPLRVLGNIREVGLRRSAAIYVERFCEELRERRLGIKTKGDVSGYELSADPACHCYQ